MAVLLAGGAGYIGSHMAVELLCNGYDVVIADNFSNSKPEVLNRIKKLTEKDFVNYECDLRDEKKLDEIFTSHKIEYVIHFAGHKGAGESVELPLEYYSNNLCITMSLCKAMKRHDVKKIIFSSTACVYSPSNNMPLSETSIIGDCPNPYGWTKFISEQILRDISKADPDLSVVVLRYFNLIGAHESGDIGEDPMGTPKNLPPFIAQVGAGKQDHLNVFGDDYPTPDGSCIRDYIHVVDLVKGHVAAMKYCDTHKGSEVFNLGTGRGTSVFELVTAFENVTGHKIPTVMSERRTGDLPTSFCSAEKAEKILKWKAEKTVVESCHDTWEWQRKNPNGYM